MSDDVMTMSEQELRLEIARLEGWTDVTPNCEGWWYGNKHGGSYSVDDWPNDLAAMAALEDALTPEEQLTYAVTLNRLVAKEHPNQFIDFALAHASPLQRARAWVAVRRGETRTE